MPLRRALSTLLAAALPLSAAEPVRVVAERPALALPAPAPSTAAPAGLPPGALPPAAAVLATAVSTSAHWVVPGAHALDAANDAVRSLFDGAVKFGRVTLLGLELGDDEGVLAEQDLEPFESVSPLDRALDWKLRPRLSLGYAGLAATHRDPGFARSVRLSAKYYDDMAGLAGLGDARDSVLGRKDYPKGYEAGAAVVFDEHWGASLSRSDKTRERPDSYERSEHTGLGVGFTPLGLNDGKPWNLSLLAGVNYAEVERRDAERDEDLEGFGWSAGVAFQHALRELPLPWINPEGGRHDDGIWLERFTASLGVSDSEISELSVRAAAGVTGFITEHLKFSCEIGASCEPGTGEFDWGPRFGFSYRF